MCSCGLRAFSEQLAQRLIEDLALVAAVLPALYAGLTHLRPATLASCHLCLPESYTAYV
jgi:hypothetical protein